MRRLAPLIVLAGTFALGIATPRSTTRPQGAYAAEVGETREAIAAAPITDEERELLLLHLSLPLP